MGKHHDWTSIEKDYQENGLSYSQIAKKYEISIDTLKKAAARQGWAKKKKKAVNESLARSVETALSKMAPAEMAPENGTSAEIVPLYPDKILPAEDDATRFQRLVNELLDRVEDAICNVDVTNAGAVKLLTGALKDLRNLKGLDKSELDIEEQKARIETLKSETRVTEDAGESGVIVLPEIEKVVPPE